MRSRPDPDAHLGPRARAANRDERVGLSAFIAVLWMVLGALYLAMAIATPDNAFLWLSAAGWIVVGGLWWRRYLVTSRAIRSPSDHPDDGHD